MDFSRTDRLQNAVPVAKGTGFLQLFMQLQRSLQPAILCQKGALRTTRKTSGMDDVLVFLRGLYVGISIATWVAKVAQRYGRPRLHYIHVHVVVSDTRKSSKGEYSR